VVPDLSRRETQFRRFARWQPGYHAAVLTAIAQELRARRGFTGVLPWTAFAACHGRTELFFPNLRERPERRARREAEARRLCSSCPVVAACRSWARSNREYGFWGGESEEERADAGFRAAISPGSAEYNVDSRTRRAG
jgi:transcription factor WhiB